MTEWKLSGAAKLSPWGTKEFDIAGRTFGMAMRASNKTFRICCLC